MSDITLPRAVVEQVREALKELDYASEPYVNEIARTTLATLDAALAEPNAKPKPDAIAELFAQFAAKQRPLDADMAAIINANLDSLYITDEPAAALAEPETVAVDLAKEGSDKTVISFVTVPRAAKREPANLTQIAESYRSDGSVVPMYWVDGWKAAERFHGIRGSK